MKTFYSGCKQSADGIGYMGTEMTSSTGRPCESWASHDLTNPDHFPDVSVEAAENYCRNPDAKPEGLWCYVGEDEWEYCDIPYCEG